MSRNSYNTYLIDGKLYVSVSTILNVEGAPALIPWALKRFGPSDNPLQAYNDFMEDVSDQGTRIHAFIEHTLKGDAKAAASMVSDDIAPAITSFLNWLDENEIEMIQSEYQCKSDKYRVAGTCDLVAKINGKLYVADIKTGSVQAKAFTQMAAYKSMMLEAGLKIKGLDKAGLAVLNVHRDGGAVKFITHNDYYKGQMDVNDELEIFHSMRYIWGKRSLKNKKFSPIIKDMSSLISPLAEDFKKVFNI